jgi:hypothetical protein
VAEAKAAFLLLPVMVNGVIAGVNKQMTILLTWNRHFTVTRNGVGAFGVVGESTYVSRH